MSDKNETDSDDTTTDVWNNKPYKCNACGDRVNYTFILKFIKESGLCPNCYAEQK